MRFVHHNQIERATTPNVIIVAARPELDVSAVLQVKHHLIGARRVTLHKRVQFGVFGVRVVLALTELHTQAIKADLRRLKLMRRVQYSFATVNESPRFAWLDYARFTVLAWHWQNA